MNQRNHLSSSANRPQKMTLKEASVQGLIGRAGFQVSVPSISRAIRSATKPNSKGFMTVCTVPDLSDHRLSRTLRLGASTFCLVHDHSAQAVVGHPNLNDTVDNSDDGFQD